MLFNPRINGGIPLDSAIEIAAIPFSTSVARATSRS
jgi:hypothetical protein